MGMANDLIGPPVERILSIDGTGRLACLLKDGSRSTIMLASNEPRPDEGVTIYRGAEGGCVADRPDHGIPSKHRGEAGASRETGTLRGAGAGTAGRAFARRAAPATHGEPVGLPVRPLPTARPQVT